MAYGSERSEPRRRRRPAFSCIECRRRKIKCDRNDPCSRCVSAETQCVYSVSKNTSIGQRRPQQLRLSSGDTHSPSYHSDNELVHPEEFVCNGRDTPLVSTNGASRDYIIDPVEDNLSRSSNSGQRLDKELQRLVERVQELEKINSVPNSAWPSPARDKTDYQAGLSDLQTTIVKTRISKSGKSSSVTQELAKSVAYFQEAIGNGNGIYFQGSDVRPLVTDTRNILHECKILAKQIKIERPTRSLSPQGFSLIAPPRLESDSMVSLYFQYFESTHRVLHIPTFWTRYEQYWDNPNHAPMALCLEILLVIALGSSLSDQRTKDVEFRNQVQQWVYAAQTWLSGPLEKDRLTVLGIQIHCLTMIARQVFSFGGDLSWTSMGSLIHRAMQIGLHRDPKHLPAMPLWQAEIRRRLWVTILEMTAQSSLDSEMPPRISFDEFDTEPPSNVNDEEIGESTMSLRPHPKEEYTMTSIQLLLLTSLRSRLRIPQLLNGLPSDIPYTEVLSLTSDILDACGSCSILADGNPAVTPFHRNMVDLLVRRFLLHLHVQFSCRARTNPMFYYSRKIGLDAAMAMASPEPDKTFSRLMLVGGSFLRNAIRFSGFVISLELIMQTQEQRSDMTLHRNSERRETLKNAVTKLLSLSAERIQHGETNVKNHMFLSMVLAETESIEAGTDIECNIAQSAQDSLQMCRDFLQIQVADHATSLPLHDIDVVDVGRDLDNYLGAFDIDSFLGEAIWS